MCPFHLMCIFLISTSYWLPAKKRENKSDKIHAFWCLQRTGQSRHTNVKELSNNVSKAVLYSMIIVKTMYL